MVSSLSKVIEVFHFLFIIKQAEAVCSMPIMLPVVGAMIDVDINREKERMKYPMNLGQNIT